MIKDTPKGMPVEPPESEYSDVIQYMEETYPEMTSEFKKIQQEQYELFCRKQYDYGPQNIAVGTILKTKEDIKLSLLGLWFRMNDKIQRLKTLLMNKRESAVVGEPLEDAYLDVSNYGIMATIVKNGKGEMQIGGVIYSDSADKSARFIMNCNQKKIYIKQTATR